MIQNEFMNKLKILFLFIFSCIVFSSCSQIPDYSEDSPSGSITINDGDFYTQTTSVILSIDVPEADEMCFSNDKVTWTAWETYSVSKNWVIDSGHWIKTVYGKFRKSGKGTSVISDSIIPLFERKIFASDGVANANFGGGHWSFTTENICISADGFTVIVGAATTSNAVYVYKRNGSGWDQTKISLLDTGIYFGNAIACTPDAHILVIGGLYKPAFYVYEWNGSSYVPTDTIISPTSPQINDFAVTLSISDDGNKIAVGSWHHPSSTYKGAVYLYERNKSSWPATYEIKFTESDLANYDNYGLGVKISGDGNTIAVGAPSQQSGKGAVYIYKFTGSIWSMIKKFTGESNYFLGRHIGMSFNGKKIIASERVASGGNTNQGAAHIYDWNGSTYTETKILKASDSAADDKFGYSVSMSSDGNMIAVGAPLANGSTVKGKAYVYGFNGYDWVEEHKLTASDGLAGDFYGNMVAISGDGSVVVVGAPLDDIGSNTDQGSVYLYY